MLVVRCLNFPKKKLYFVSRIVFKSYNLNKKIEVFRNVCVELLCNGFDIFSGEIYCISFAVATPGKIVFKGLEKVDIF